MYRFSLRNMQHRLDMDDFSEDTFELIAVHCTEEDFRLAYLLNNYLKIKLVRAKTDLDFYKNQKQINFPLFEYEDSKNYISYNLLSNVQKILSEEVASASDFYKNVYETHYVIPEIKCDYLLKIASDSGKIKVKEIVSKINEIRQVISAYNVAVEKLKSKNNLIFD